jgi:DNA-binding NarL/FixJ family response regulator
VPYSILIVDDSPIVRWSLRRFVEQNNAWNVCGEAENGQIAIKKVRQLTPDLVILDLRMPVMGGFEAARQIAPSVTAHDYRFVHHAQFGAS